MGFSNIRLDVGPSPELVRLFTGIRKNPPESFLIWQTRALDLSDRIVELSYPWRKKWTTIRPWWCGRFPWKSRSNWPFRKAAVSLALFAATLSLIVLILSHFFWDICQRKICPDYPGHLPMKRAASVWIIENSWGSGEMYLESASPHPKLHEKPLMDWLGQLFSVRGQPKLAMVLTKWTLRLNIIDIFGVLKSEYLRLLCNGRMILM